MIESRVCISCLSNSGFDRLLKEKLPGRLTPPARVPFARPGYGSPGTTARACPGDFISKDLDSFGPFPFLLSATYKYIYVCVYVT